MNPALRAKAMLADPFAEWARIERESGDPAYLLSRYVAALALVPAVFGFIGSTVIGTGLPGGGTVRAALFDGAFGAILGYLLSFVLILILGFIVNVVAPLFGGRKDFDNALKLAVYSYTPVWLAGIFLVLPGLRFLSLTGFYGAYVLWLGLPQLMKSPGGKSPAYALVVAACAFALTLAVAIAQGAVFGTASF
jgi:hypothetical protein